jgi:2,4-dienoyl-CoA reductase-like NADH-dependent reductase (Old Yellow Enzyme family)
MSALFSPLTLRSVTLANRIVVSPMCQYSAERGEATAWHMIHLGSMALSGAGLLCIEATSVEPEGRITPGDLGLWDDVTEAALVPVLAAIRKHSSIPVAMQLSHAGRKASSHTPWDGGQLIPVAEGGWLPHAPSALPHKAGEEPPLALDTAGLNRVREAFAASARRAARLGIDALEVHGAHGYLLHQFLSPIANQRTDEYGGSRENRMRFPLEIFEIVRAAFPADKPVGVRVSATDWVEGGCTLDDTIAFALELKKRGCDWIDVSSGGVSPLQKIPLEPGYQVPFAHAVKQATDLTKRATPT